MTFPTCFQKSLWSESYWVVPETLDVLSGAENELRVNRYQISLCKVPVCRSPIAARYCARYFLEQFVCQADLTSRVL